MCRRRNSSVNRQSTRHPLPTFAPRFWRGGGGVATTDPTDLTLRFPQRAQPDHFSHYITLLRTTCAATDVKSLICTFSVFVTFVYHHVALCRFCFATITLNRNHHDRGEFVVGVSNTSRTARSRFGHYRLVRKQYRFTVHSIYVFV